MHASLARMSVELRTMDLIISSHNTALPLELLLLIRADLLVQLTDHLIMRSSTALQRYETSLLYLLCPECLAYHQDVYGDDVWGWDQFSGACACFTTRYRSIPPSIALRRTDFSPSTLNPKKFTNRQHWLEFYLSMKALRLIQSGCSSHSLADDPRVIWDLVSTVLEDYGCQSLRMHRSIRNRNETSSVLIVPHGRAVDAAEESCITLKRVERDLALSVEYSVPVLATSSSPMSQRSTDHCSSTAFGRGSEVLDSLHAIFLAALSLPLSIVTLLLTIVCFYSRPLAFRIL